jgi:hypothetical protein
MDAIAVIDADMNVFSVHLESTAQVDTSMLGWGGSLSQPVIGYKIDSKPMLCYVID